MAKPIKETPVLHGKDAKNFAREISQNERRTVTKEEVIKMKENFNSLKTLLKD